jgi:hypothetical protein
MNASTTNGETTSPSGSGRRDFLTLCAGAAVICAVPLADAIASRGRQAAGASTEVPPVAAMPGLAEFEPHLGSVFMAAAMESQSTVPFTLAKVEDLEKIAGFAGEQFSLRFDAPPGHRIESRIHQLRHPVLGSLDLFISPVGSADRLGGQQNGEAVISSLVRFS